ncbi:hypothetical protein CLOP_g7615 [Closterium sp. NIES-67]|nr:hypothetical protein CLOP_g4403 [Closterium sp. NIES-67]GJP77186.1 hypothetical protein CLOP_g7615 [Closterium sp. NIES-67]
MLAALSRDRPNVDMVPRAGDQRRTDDDCATPLWLLEVSPDHESSRSTLSVALADVDRFQRANDGETPVIVLVSVVIDTDGSKPASARKERSRHGATEDLILRSVMRPMQAIAESRK